MESSFRFLSADLHNEADHWEVMDFAKPQKKALDSLGHVWTKYFHAQDLLLKKATKAQLHPAIQPWVAGLSPEESLLSATNLEQGFILLVKYSGSLEEGLEVQGIVDSEAENTNLWSLWWKEQPRTPKFNFAKDLPKWRIAPVWQALIRLHELKPFWLQELRQNHYESMGDWLPAAWLFLKEPLPPGAVIARLGKRSWSDALAQGMKLEVEPAFEREFREELTSAHLTMESELKVITCPDPARCIPLVLFYSHQGGKTHLLGGLQNKKR